MANRNNNEQREYSRNKAYSPYNAASQGNVGNSPATYNTEFSREYYGKKNAKYPRKRRTGLKVFLTCLIVLLIAVGACAGVAAYYGNQLYQSALHVRAQANEAMSDLDDLKDYIVDGDMEAAKQKAQNISQIAKAMNEETDGDLWLLAENIPIYGEDVQTVRVLTDVFEDVSVNAIEPLCDEMSGISLKSLIGEGGSINVEMLSQLVDKLSAAAPVLSRSADAFNRCPKPHLDQLKDVVEKTSTQLNAANDLFEFANHFAPLLPDMMGANGARRYLIVAQNNAEARATGGFYGSVGMLTIDNGDISVGSFSSLHDSYLDETYLRYHFSDAYERISEVRFPSTNLYNLGCNPDVPHVAEVFYDTCAMADTPIDGMFLVDPVFVQYLVGLTGGFTASDGTWLDGSNLVEVLLHDTYWTYVNNNAAQDVVFDMIASDALHHVFDSIGDADVKDLLEMIMDAGVNRHVSVWMANSDEQEVIAKLKCTGEVSTDETEAVTGIYFGNDSWSKLEYYLRVDKEVTYAVENDAGSMSYGVTLTLTNTLSSDEAWSGNWYVVAGNGHGNKIMYQPGDMLESVDLVAPAGGSIEDIDAMADVYDENHGTLYGNDFHRYEIHLLPGDSATFTYVVVTSPESQGDLRFDMTPLIQDAF